MRPLVGVVLTLCACAAIGLWLTKARQVPEHLFAGLIPDPVNGTRIFAAMGCASCHASDDGPADTLSGGKAFATDFGTFFAPNISPHPTAGIGGWTDAQIASAVMAGTSPDARHYYPAFPYSAYNKADPQDVVDLIGHLRSLPHDPTPSQPHQIRFPFNIRASLGAWKLFFTHDGWVVQGELPRDQARGRYLVEALAHCGECHTPRNALGGLDRSLWLAGAPNPSGEGRIPDIRPDTLQWSAADIVAYLKTGLTPDYDSAGGSMADVIRNTRQLPDDDLQAIAAYLLAVPSSPQPQN